MRSRWYRFSSDRWSTFGLVVVVFFVVVAAFAPLINGLLDIDPYTFHAETLDAQSVPSGSFGGASTAHPLGVEPLTGRDLLAVIVAGTRTSLFIALGALAISTTLGLVIGVTAGFIGGWVDRILSGAINVLFGFPSLLFMIALSAVLPATFPRPVLVVFIVGIFGWPGMARVIRAQALSLRNRNFVRAALVIGVSPLHALVREVLPNLRALVVVFATTSMPGLIATEASLSFLGVGVPAPTPSWGRSIGDAVAWVQTDPWFLIFPGIALVLLTLGFNLVGDGLRNAFNAG
ncbi:ABC transporter permease [Nocardia sp. NPDC051756]|uniref:ABC transporter permease n=1 Tax=Nocardia sp. NPDC051756 TaxID=3154751 RepID=UPI003435BF4D